jgi:hypothetical protein
MHFRARRQRGPVDFQKSGRAIRRRPIGSIWTVVGHALMDLGQERFHAFGGVLALTGRAGAWSLRWNVEDVRHAARSLSERCEQTTAKPKHGAAL